MKTYEIPADGSASERAVEAEEGTDAEYSLEEQVRKTSETVDRLATIVEQAVQALFTRERNIDGDA